MRIKLAIKQNLMQITSTQYCAWR